MKKTLKNNPPELLINSVRRHYSVIFITIIVCLLIASIILLTNIINSPSRSTSTQAQPSTSTTVELSPINNNRLAKLETSDNNTSYQTLPSGRINPFGE